MSRNYLKGVYIVSIFLLGMSIVAVLNDRTTIDPHIRSDAKLLDAVQKAINGSVAHPGRYCQSAVLKPLEGVSKIAPGCDFVRIAWRRSLISSGADSGPTVAFELLAFRRSNSEVMSIPAANGSAEWIPKFLVWAQCQLNNSNDASEIENAIGQIFRNTIRSDALPKIRSTGSNRWIISVAERLSAHTEFELETNSDGRVDRFQPVTGSDSK